MKFFTQTFFILTVFLLSTCAFAQNTKINLVEFYSPLISEKSLRKNNYLNKYAGKDFSAVWNYHKNNEYLGFIGDDYHRIRIKILSTVKDEEKLQTYTVKGKSAIGSQIKPFEGTFTVRQIKLLTDLHWGVDDEYKNKGIKAQGVLIGEYKLYEDRKLENSGFFEGVLSALWYMTETGEIKFDNIQFEADPYRNNQFVGTWTNYNETKKMKSNWGDYRIPDSGDLDIGAGEFSPNKKYLKNGWNLMLKICIKSRKTLLIGMTNRSKGVLKTKTRPTNQWT